MCAALGALLVQNFSSTIKLRGLNMRSHLGISFTVWRRQRTWFWLVLNQHRNGGTIGTATSEAQATRDACSSIEEISVRLPSNYALPSPSDDNPYAPMSYAGGK